MSLALRLPRKKKDRTMFAAIFMVGILALVGISLFNVINTNQNQCNGILRLFGRCFEGTDTCTINSGTTACSKIETYATPFNNNPDMRYLTMKATGGFTGTQTASFKSDYLFQATNISLTWHKYPTKATVWLNESTGAAGGGGFPIQQSAVWTGATMFNFEIGCDAQNFVNTGTEVLALQYSLTDPSTIGFVWNNLTTVNVSNLNCGWGFLGLSQSGFLAIPIPAQTTVFLQLVGWGGNNALNDAVSFAFVKVEIKFPQAIQISVLCIDATNPLSLPKLRFVINCLSNFAPPTGQSTLVTFEWQTWGYLG